MKQLSYYRYKGKDEDLIFKAVAELLEERLPQAVGWYGCDLSIFLFNEEKYFVWNTTAEEACESVGVWNAIRLVQNYETDRYNEVYTKTEPLEVANMLVYIYGEYVLSQVKHLAIEAWSRELTELDIRIITKQISSWAYKNLPSDDNPYGKTLGELVWNEWNNC